MELARRAMYEEQEEHLYYRWVNGHYDYKLSFPEFKREVGAPVALNAPNVPKIQTKEETLSKVEKLLDLEWRVT